MKVDVLLRDLTNDQIATVLLLIPHDDRDPVSWKVGSWVFNNRHANLNIQGIEDDALQAIFFELRERTVVTTSSRKGR